MIRVLIADEQALVRAGFRAILDHEPDLQVVGEAADGREALAQARALLPDVVLMDVRMPDVDGIEATRRLLAVAPRERGLSDPAWWVRANCADALAGSARGILALRRTLVAGNARSLATVPARRWPFGPCAGRICGRSRRPRDGRAARRRDRVECRDGGALPACAAPCRYAQRR